MRIGKIRRWPGVESNATGETRNKYLIRLKEDAILETSEHDDSADAANVSPILRIADKFVLYLFFCFIFFWILFYFLLFRIIY
mgnify:CR=1 FL=1